MKTVIPIKHINEINKIFEKLKKLKEILEDKNNYQLLEIENEDEIKEVINIINYFQNLLNNYLIKNEKELMKAIEDYISKKELLKIDESILELLKQINYFLIQSFNVIKENRKRLEEENKIKKDEEIF